MYGVRAVPDGRGENVGHVEVGLLAWRRTDAHGLVRQLHVKGILVRDGVHGYGLQAELLASSDHPHGDLAPVRDEHLGDGVAPLSLASRRAGHLARARHPPRCGPGTPQAQADPVVYESARTPLFLGRDASRGSPVRSWLAGGGALGHDRPRRPRRHQAHRRKTSPLRCPRTKTRSEPVVSRETAFLIAFSLSPSHIFTFRQKCCHRKVHRNPDARQEPRNQGGVQLPNDEAGGRGRLVVRSA